MFTGIITDIGTIAEVTAQGNARRMVVRTGLNTASWKLGCSVACAGVCLTVVEVEAGQFTVDVSEESLRCTTLGAWTAGTRINLEPALKMGDELGGHIVSGHVDAVGKVLRVESLELSGEWEQKKGLVSPASLEPAEGSSLSASKKASGGHEVITFQAPSALLPLIAVKGSIVIEGVSLTVNAVEGDSFSVNLIPHTQAVTTLGGLKEGDAVNLEADMLARYVARMMECKTC